MDKISDLARQTAELHALITGYHFIREHPKGHSAKMLRYLANSGAELAVEKRKGTPLLYLTRATADGRIDQAELEWVSASRTGRNSNLNTLESFRDSPLARVRVTTLDTARRAIEACVRG